MVHRITRSWDHGRDQGIRGSRDSGITGSWDHGATIHIELTGVGVVLIPGESASAQDGRGRSEREIGFRV